MARAELQQMLSEYENRVVLVTAIPISAEGEAQQRTGKTFLIASLRNAIYLLDSHTHHPFDPLAKPGMLRACVASTCACASKRAQVLCDWIWDDRGFLMELQCDRHLVDITVLRKAVCPSVSSQRAQQGMAVAVACQGASAGLGISSDALGVSSKGGTASAIRARGAARLKPSSGMRVPRNVFAPENHDVEHQINVPGCPRCRWRRRGRVWQKNHAFHHPVTGQWTSPIVEKPLDMPGPWGIGCSICANHTAGKAFPAGRKRTAFATFDVCTWSKIQGGRSTAIANRRCTKRPWKHSGVQLEKILKRSQRLMRPGG